MSNIVVIGAGPAGIMAAIVAAKAGHHVTLLEKNEKIGKKLFITTPKVEYFSPPWTMNTVNGKKKNRTKK